MGRGIGCSAKRIGAASLVGAALLSSTAGAQIKVTPDHFYFPNMPVGAVFTDTLIFENTHITETIPVAASETDCMKPVDIPWMSVAPVTLTLPAGYTGTIEVTYDVKGYPAGPLMGNLCLGDPATGAPYADVPTDICIGGNCVSASPIPTIKEWGMAIMALLLLGGAAFELRRRLS